MKYLQKKWFRVVLSLLAGGFASEIIHINSGDPNKPSSSGDSYLVIIFAGITFLVLSAVVNNRKSIH